jgi:protocatechuate 3,4-dioxygenase alpha subunit
MLPLTPSQTVGPFFHVAIPARGRETLVTDATPGPRIVVDGSVLDGAGDPVPDALIEIWQANASGRWNHPEDPRSQERDRNFEGFGRVGTGADGRFAIETVRPGAVPGPNEQPGAPHLLVGVFARGLLTRLVTRIYFEDEPSNALDPVLALVPADRRSTLVARRNREGHYAFDIVLQGAGETVFFDV